MYRYCVNILQIVVVLLLLDAGKIHAQDAQFSQFFATRIYLNPALAGNTHFSRFSTQFRRQWPTLQGYTTTGFYYDQNLQPFNSGVALSILQDRQAAGGLMSNEVTGMYSYRFKLSRKIFVRLGLATSYTSYRVDLSQFVFTDQLLSGSSRTGDDYQFDRTRYFDINTGAILYSENYWIGFSASNLNNFRNDFDNPFPIRYSTHGGILIPINPDIKGDFLKYLTVAGHYKAQQDFDQFDLGAYYGFKFVLIGVWYRGLLALKDNEASVPNHDAVIVVAGLKHEGMRLTYSYDITASTIAGYSGGAHEMSLQIDLWSKFKYKKRRNSELNVPCPTFGGPGWQVESD